MYRRRVLDGLLDELQPHLQAVSIHGAKGVGKTATAVQRGETIFSLDREIERAAFAADPESLMATPGPIVIDEWQRWPESWDRVRRAVDDGVPPGHIILTGSSAPRGATIHSGAGRIVPFTLRPLSLVERDVAQPVVGLAQMLDGMEPRVEGVTSVTLTGYVDEIIASGFPGIRSKPARVRPALLDAYLENIAMREFPEQGYPVRKPATLMAWMAAYAAATSTTTKYNRILEAASPGVDELPSKSSTLTYRDALSGLYILDPLPAWLPARNEFDRLGASPKHQLVDPGLAARLLGANEKSLLRGRHNHMLGQLFEHLVAQSVQTYATAAGAAVRHLRTRDNRHEADLIVEKDGQVVALEVKLAQNASDDDVKHLHWLRSKLGDDLLDAAVITTGPRAYRRPDGIAVIPAALLGP